MIRYISITILLSISVFSNAQKATLSEGAKLLFKDTKSKLSDAEKNLIILKLQLELSKDKKEFVMAEYPVNVNVFPTDMNKDGKEEIFVSLKSSALFGNTGEDFVIFMKKNDGVLEQRAEIGGGIPVFLSTKNLGYPDILIGGPGLEFPVYRWDGKKYRLNRKMKDAVLQKIKSTDIEGYSKLYTDTIQQ